MHVDSRLHCTDIATHSFARRAAWRRRQKRSLRRRRRQSGRPAVVRSKHSPASKRRSFRSKRHTGRRCQGRKAQASARARRLKSTTEGVGETEGQALPRTAFTKDPNWYSSDRGRRKQVVRERVAFPSLRRRACLPFGLGFEISPMPSVFCVLEPVLAMMCS